MRIELVTVGTELLLGFTVDSNAAWLGSRLAELGITVVRRTTVPDREDAIRSAVSEALARTGWVITSGGLGPTSDDLTRPAVAEVLGAPLQFDQAVWDTIVARFRGFGREPSPQNRIQAEVPEGAEVLPNRWGTAPGLWLEGPEGTAILLPGVPRELRRLFETAVAPRLIEQLGTTATVVRSLTVRTTSIPESTLAARLSEFEAGLDRVDLAYLPGLEGVDLRLTVAGLEAGEAAARLEDSARALEELLPGLVYGRDEDDLAAVLLDRLRSAGRTLALAESCTGGLVGARLTAIPGSSEVFLGGVTGYANSAKRDLLGVSQELLDTEGAVSEAVALAMADGARLRFGADVGLAVTGIAGPGGGSEARPVGTVWFAWAEPEGSGATRRVFPGNRGEIRTRAAQYALHGLLRRLGGEAPA